MCGILYISNNKKYSKVQSLGALKKMTHRGPDNIGYKIINRNFFGHTRLSIIDLNKRSNQPFRSDGLLIIYNGEVYNYKELISEHNLEVTTQSDTEVILLMYKKYGASCLDYFNGMFAFIIYNENTGDTFAARDRLGIKPLYYYNSGDQWIFSSEIASILELENSELDEFGLRQYRKLRMTIKDYTIYKDVKMFPSAHYWYNGKFTRYWDLIIEPKEPPPNDELKWLIEDAINLRTRSDVPVGSYLSGGLDSTILTYVLKPNNTWTVGFEELNEFEWSDLANSKLNTLHHKTLIDKNKFLLTAKWMINKRREPLSVPNEVLIYIMTKDVKKRNTVILSGEGADELFWGYDRIFKWAYNAKSLDLKKFDKKYCYGTHIDDEILHFALENIPGQKVVDKIAYFFQIYHLQGLLRRLDNSTMLCSVEARVPFVDHRLVELVAGTPFHWRMGKSFKQPLKTIFCDLIPKPIINRQKVGFPVPLKNIFSAYDQNYSNSPMDNWLDFNLNQVINNPKGNK